MRRRALLGSLVGGFCSLAGCQSLLDSKETGSCTIPGERQMRVGAAKDLPTDAGVSVKPRVETAVLSRNQPLQLTISIKNTGDTIYTKYTDDDQCHPFNRVAGRSDPRGVWLYRHQNAPSTDTETCWQQDTPAHNTRTFQGYACTLHELAPGASITTTYDVWDDYTTDGYLPPDTYRFETTIPIHNTPEDDQEPTRHDWWFELDITTPDE